MAGLFSPFGRKEVIEDVSVPSKMKIKVDEDKYTKRLVVRVGDLARMVEN